MKTFIHTRQELEQDERRMLAPFAVASADSRSRSFPEPEHPWRTCFQRDRDRVIHSAAFRRLEAKTQVFFSPDSDYYRTRLTHTIEVAQIARSLARTLGVNEDLAEATALAHDLGHPPYGHSGEEILNTLMADHGGFEHNRHSLRIVDYLEHPYPGFRGLNLSFETRQCLAKHETRYDQGGLLPEFGGGFAPLEGQIADLADTIAYNSHDLDDALAANLIAEKELQGVELYQDLARRIGDQYPDAHPFARRLRSAKGLIDLLIQDVLQETAARLAKYEPKTVADVERAETKLVSLSDARRGQLDQLQDFLLKNVYLHPRLEPARQQARIELTFLFEMFLTRPDRLPERYQQRIPDQSPHRVICDYIAGMTDRFCHTLYIEITEC
jgi:dGTPase